MPIIFSGGGGTLSEAASGAHHIKQFTGNTTYTPTTGTKYITVHVIGGGGGGASGSELSGEQNMDERGFGGGGGGGYCIGNYNITGSFSGAITVGGGGAGGQASAHQFRAGGNGGNSVFQPSGSYNGSGQITANGGNGAPANLGNGAGGGAVGGVVFKGEDGEATTGVGGEHQSMTSGVGGVSGHSDNTYGIGADGNKTPNAINGQNGTAGFVYIMEYIG